jgi:hypothetical protein
MPFASAEELFGSESPFQTKRENEWPLVLCAAHFDESHEKPGLAVAGYSAAIDTWWRLDCQWQALLKRWNLKYFKASECEKGLVEFAQYRDDLAAPKSSLKPQAIEKSKSSYHLSGQILLYWGSVVPSCRCDAGDRYQYAPLRE